MLSTVWLAAADNVITGAIILNPGVEVAVVKTPHVNVIVAPETAAKLVAVNPVKVAVPAEPALVSVPPNVQVP